MKMVQYIQGRAVEVPLPRWQRDAVIELSLPDGRTVQVAFESTGEVYLRGWGNVPAKLGNWNRMMFVGCIECEEPTHCEVCYNKLGGCGCAGREGEV